jgi:hypothetical protein
MDNKNIFIIILIIITLFFLSGNDNITTQSLNNNAFPLLLVLVIFYIYYNNFSMGLVFICLILLVISTTNIKDIIIQRLDYHTDNRFSERFNELLSFIPQSSEHLTNTYEEEDDNSVFDSTEGLDDLSYNDFKQEIGSFNGETVEPQEQSPGQPQPQGQPQGQSQGQEQPQGQSQGQPQGQPQGQSQEQESILSINELNKNNGRDVNNMFEELSTQLNTLRSK